MSHFTQISATLINEKYYKGHSQAGKKQNQSHGDAKGGENGEGCVHVYACVLVCRYLSV